MLDEKGRLFGKINIVDLLIVLVLIAAVAFVGIKYVMPHNDDWDYDSDWDSGWDSGYDSDWDSDW